MDFSLLSLFMSGLAFSAGATLAWIMVRALYLLIAGE